MKRRKFTPSEAKQVFERVAQAAAKDTRYKGYWLRFSALHGWRIEKNGAHIAWVPSLEAGRAAIDEIATPGENPMKRAKWKTGDRFRLKYDFNYPHDKVSYKAGDTGRITLYSGPPIPAAFGVFDSTPKMYPLSLSLKAIEKVRGKNPRKRAAPLRSRRVTKRARKPSARMSILARNNPHEIWVQIMRGGKWHDVDGYAGEEGAKAMANVFGRAGFTARVVRK